MGNGETESVTVDVAESRVLTLERALALISDALVVALLRALADGGFDKDELVETEPVLDGDMLETHVTVASPDAVVL